MKDNTRVIKEAFKAQMPIWYDEIWKNLDEFCSRLLLDAVIRYRESGDQGGSFPHNFTGNLINSIVVILFRRDTGEKCDYFAYDEIGRPPIRRKMSSINKRGEPRKNAIHFSPDWDYQDSAYKPEVQTDNGFGQEDARSFAANWMPSTNKNFEICVAYTTEYATFVQMQRKTTGYISSIIYTKKVLIKRGFKKA